MPRDLELKLVSDVVGAIQEVVGSSPVQLHEPTFEGNEWNYIKDCLDTGWVSSVGKYVDRFESNLQSFTGARYAVATVNGTSALHVALLLAGVKKGDEVLIPSLTFVATANAVSYCGAMPHLVDSEERTLGVDPKALRDYLKIISEIRGGQCVNKSTGQVIRALVPMHTFGHPVDIEGLMAVANDFKLIIVEDAAESLGSTYAGFHTGTFGLLGVYSFNGNKTITTGGGGALITNNRELAHQAKHITTTAKVAHRWEFIHDDIGYNYRMPNINAALGCAQLEQIEEFLIAKANLLDRYKAAFSRISNVGFVEGLPDSRSNNWLQALIINKSVSRVRDEILSVTNNLGIMTRPAWRLISKLAPYKTCPKMDLPVSERLEQSLINLPSSVSLNND